jgi:hypothetical protein
LPFPNDRLARKFPETVKLRGNIRSNRIPGRVL